MTEVIKTNRPHSTPPTNVELSNDYTGIDRGLFLSRDPDPKYLRVTQAEWKSYGPSGAPGVLRFKIGQFESKPESDSDYNNFTLLKAKDDSEWFDVVTSGPIHAPILVEYWAKFIYYNYYVQEVDIDSVHDHPPLMTDIMDTGNGFTRAVAPAIDKVVNTALFNVANGKPLQLSSYITSVIPKVGPTKNMDFTEEITIANRFDPVITAMRRL